MLTLAGMTRLSITLFMSAITCITFEQLVQSGKVIRARCSA